MNATQRRAHRDMQNAMDELQEDLRNRWIEDSLPPGWNGLDSFDGVKPHKTRVTIRLDADMVRWFRKLGPNYSQRMNDVLRIYWQALLAGHVRAYYEDNPAPRMLSEMRAQLRRMEQNRND